MRATIVSAAVLDVLWRHTRWVRDAGVYRAALSIAGDREARVYALGALTMLRDPGVSIVSYSAMLQQAPVGTRGKGPCAFSRRIGAWPFSGEPPLALYADSVVSR